MTADAPFSRLREKAPKADEGQSYSTSVIASLTDLTRLDPNATASDIKALTEKGIEHQVAALCVLPQHLEFIPKEAKITRATVANFPTGNEPIDDVLRTIEHAITHHQADEIDYVFPYQAYLAGDTAYALTCCAKAYQQTKLHGALFKVILETGALPSQDIIYELSLAVIHNGCDFLKTSTGKIAIGATIPAAFAMLSAIKDSKTTCGIKLSGGIRTVEQAEQYMSLAEHMTGLTLDKRWFRLGTSSLLHTMPTLLNSLDKFSTDVMATRDQPKQQKREDLF